MVALSPGWSPLGAVITSLEPLPGPSLVALSPGSSPEGMVVPEPELPGPELPEPELPGPELPVGSVEPVLSS